MNREHGANGAQRRQFTPEDKATILRRHLVDKVPVSDLCDEYHLQPSLVYLWQRQALENLATAFRDGRSRRGQQRAPAGERERIGALEAKLAKKEAVIAAVSEEYLALKKKLGES